MGTIDQFASKFGEGQRVSLFRVRGAFGHTNQSLNNTEFMIKSAQFPASNIGVIEVPYRGRKIKTPGDRVFNEWSISVLLDKENEMYDAFVGWMDGLNSHSNVESAGQATNLRQDWTITSLAPDGTDNSEVVMKNCFPTEVGTVDFNWETTDTIAEFAVTMQFDYWTKSGATT